VSLTCLRKVCNSLVRTCIVRPCVVPRSEASPVHVTCIDLVLCLTHSAANKAQWIFHFIQHDLFYTSIYVDRLSVLWQCVWSTFCFWLRICGNTRLFGLTLRELMHRFCVLSSQCVDPHPPTSRNHPQSCKAWRGRNARPNAESRVEVLRRGSESPPHQLSGLWSLSVSSPAGVGRKCILEHSECRKCVRRQTISQGEVIPISPTPIWTQSTTPPVDAPLSGYTYRIPFPYTLDARLKASNLLTFICSDIHFLTKFPFFYSTLLKSLISEYTDKVFESQDTTKNIV